MMSSSKIIKVLVSIAALTFLHVKAMEDDSVTLLQAQLQEKTTELVIDDEHVDGYKLSETLNCANEKVASAQEAAFVSPASVSTKMPVVATTPSSDPPGAGALRAVLGFMVCLLIADGACRLYRERRDTQKLGDAGKALANENAAVEAAWVEMVNAASTGNIQSFKKSLENKASVTQADAWGCTALHFAAVGGSATIASELLKHGAEVDAIDASDETPLHFAARAGHAAICELLIGAGAKMDAVNVQDMTPLVVAGHANAAAACRLLVQEGAGVAGMADDSLPLLVVSQIIEKAFATKE